MPTTPNPQIASLSIERERFPGHGIYEPVEVKNHYYGPEERHRESYEALITPIPVNTTSRIDIIGQHVAGEEVINSAGPVERHVIVEIPNARIKPVVINHRVDLLVDPLEKLRIFGNMRGLMNVERGPFSIEADLFLLIRHINEAIYLDQAFPIGQDSTGRGLRAQLLTL